LAIPTQRLPPGESTLSEPLAGIAAQLSMVAAPEEAETSPIHRIEPEPLPQVGEEAIDVVRIDAEPESPMEAADTLDGRRPASQVDDDAPTHRVPLLEDSKIPSGPVPLLPVAIAPTLALPFAPADAKPVVIATSPTVALPFAAANSDLATSPTAAHPIAAAEALYGEEDSVSRPATELPSLVPEAQLPWSPVAPTGIVRPPTRRGPNTIVVLFAVLSVLFVGAVIYQRRSSHQHLAEGKPLPAVGTLASAPQPTTPPPSSELRPASPPVGAVPETTPAPARPAVAIAPAAPAPSAAPPSPTAAAPAAAPPVPVTAPAKSATPTAVKELVANSGSVEIATTPPGASLFLDGELRGTTPARLTLGGGAHQLVLVAEHMKLIKRPVSGGSGRVDLTLEPAKLPADIAGSASLKVRCKTRGELRVFVDGADSGLSCPNDQRIYVSAGTHKIGLYSPRSGEVREVEHDVPDGDHSTRIYFKY
jgi:hypothetical protein